MLGQILGGHYQIEQELGKKAGRRTYLARDLETENWVVIKLLVFNQEFAWQDLKLFEREAQTLHNLSHPSIPRYLNYFEVDLPELKGFALVQTYIEAKSLEEQLQAGRTFSEEEVKQIAKMLLEILMYLHQQKPPVIHRDIKPSNILLTSRSAHSIGQVYLIDFGSVQTLAAREDGTMTVVGTYGYMPPEQFGRRVVPASDLYSLGTTLIYLVTGVHPADLPQQDLRVQFEPFTHLSPALTQWLKQMVEPSLDRRFSSVQAALDGLENPPVIAVSPAQMRQPAGSKIALVKTEETFQVIVPPQGFHPGLIFIGLFAIAWNSFITLWTGMSLMAPFPINLGFALFSLPFWGVGLSMIVGILFPLFGRVKFQIDRQHISLRFELFGLTYPFSRPSPYHPIDRLEQTKLAYTRDSDGDSVKVNPSLRIWAGNQKYELNTTYLTEPELDWLAQELSQWLGLTHQAENSSKKLWIKTT
jgi:serine/threonine protein kinase